MNNKKLKLTDERSYFKPFSYPWCYDFWLRSEQSHWIHTEVPLLEDVKDWDTKLTPGEKNCLTQIFRFFTQADIDVSEGYVKNYLPHFPQPEVRMMLLSFAARECTHISAYSYLVETIGFPETTYNEFFEYKEMHEKHNFFESFIKKDKKNIIQQIAAFSAFTEGLQLFSSFIILLNFPRHGLMKGMGQIISWSVADETQHVEGMIKLFRTLVEENRQVWNNEIKSEIYNICTKMVELEDMFIDLAFNMGEMKNLTSSEVKQYIRYIADRRLISLGMKGVFKVKKNPLPWVETMINAPSHTNFFENKSTDYSKGSVTGSWSEVWSDG